MPLDPRRFTLLFCLALSLIAPWSPVQGEDGEESEAKSPRSYVLRARRVYLGEGAPRENVALVVRDGKVAAVLEADESAPEDLPVLDLSTQTILPGFVAVGLPLAGTNSSQRSIAPEFLALDGFDFFSQRQDLLRAGITTVGVSTGSSRLLSGRGCVVKAGGAKGDVRRRLLRAAVGFQVTLGEASKRPPAEYEPPLEPSPDEPFEVLPIEPPVTRGGALRELRNLLEQAREYDAARGAGESVELDPGLEALRHLFRGDDFLLVRAERSLDILRMLDLAREFDVPLVFDGAREAYRLLPVMEETDVPVVVRGDFRPGSLSRDDPSRTTLSGAARDGLATMLLRSGVKVALKSPDPQLASILLLQALETVRRGVAPDVALRAITRSPAEILGVSERVGHLGVGCDADFVVFDEDPFESSGAPVATFVDGVLAYPEAREMPDDITVVRCGKVITGDGRSITGGVIVLREGKVHAVGHSLLLGAFPQAPRVIDATSETVIPGMIDAGSQIGLHEDRLFATASRAQPSAGGGSATYRIVEAIDPQDPDYDRVLRAGITTVVLTPDPVGSFSGQLTALKTAAIGDAAQRERLADPAALLIGRLSSRELTQAKKYHDTWEAYEKAKKEAEEREELEPAADDEGDAKPAGSSGGDGKKPEAPEEPDTNADLEVLRQVFQGELRVLLRATSEPLLKNLLNSFVDKYEPRTLVYGPSAISASMRKELRKRGIGILLEPEVLARGGAGLAGELARDGLPFAFRTATGAGARDLRFHVAYAVREGLNEDVALRALTLAPAELLGVDERVGSIARGKDADLVFLDGPPFRLTTRVTRVMVGGEIVVGEGSDGEREGSENDALASAPGGAVAGEEEQKP